MTSSAPAFDVLQTAITRALVAARAETAPSFASRELDMSKSVGEVVRGDCIRERNLYYTVVAIAGDEWEGEEVRGGEVVLKNLFLDTEVKRGDLQRVNLANFVCEIDKVDTFMTGEEVAEYLPPSSASIRLSSNSREYGALQYGLHLTDNPCNLGVNVWDKDKVVNQMRRQGHAVSVLVLILYFAVILSIRLDPGDLSGSCLFVCMSSICLDLDASLECGCLAWILTICWNVFLRLAFGRLDGMCLFGLHFDASLECSCLACILTLRWNVLVWLVF